MSTKSSKRYFRNRKKKLAGSNYGVESRYALRLHSGLFNICTPSHLCIFCCVHHTDICWRTRMEFYIILKIGNTRYFVFFVLFSLWHGVFSVFYCFLAEKACFYFQTYKNDNDLKSLIFFKKIILSSLSYDFTTPWSIGKHSIVTIFQNQSCVLCGAILANKNLYDGLTKCLGFFFSFYMNSVLWYFK